METAFDLLPGRLLRNAGPPTPLKNFRGVQIDDARLSMVVSPDASLLTLYEGTLHGEGPAWQAKRDRLVWSDVPNRRLLGWYPDGHVEVLIRRHVVHEWQCGRGGRHARPLRARPALHQQGRRL
ncbi:MAG: hypothetical protein WB766_11850 [Roseiarcus sp.]